MIRSRSKISRQAVKKSNRVVARKTAPTMPMKRAAKRKWVYSFGGGKAAGRADMRNLLGGKGAGLAEMARLGLLAMASCRPIEFHPGEAPSLGGLVSGLIMQSQKRDH